MIGLSGEIPLVSHSDVTSPFPPSGNGGYASNRDVIIIVIITPEDVAAEFRRLWISSAQNCAFYVGFFTYF